MGNNFKIVNILCVTACYLTSFLTSCKKTIKFDSRTIQDAMVGKEYEQSIAIPEIDNLVYTTDNTLPDGISLSQDGILSGIPTAITTCEFSVTAIGEGYSDATAVFSFSVKEGALRFDDQEVEITVNEPCNQKLIAKDGINIRYQIKSGSLPDGITLNEDGTFKGTATAVGNYRLKVTVTAKDCVSAEAEITINVILPKLGFEGKTLKNGRVNQFYGEQLPVATGSENVTYALKEGSTLPKGLTLSESGYLQGTPSERATRAKFTVVVSAKGFTSAEAEFTLTVLAAMNVDNEGTIIYEAKPLKTAYVGEKYSAAGGVAGASADNYATITYELAENSSLPEGFEITPNGDLRCDAGAKTAGTFKFQVKASAEKCQSVTAQFTLEIAPTKLTFNGAKIQTGMVGSQYSESLATAKKPGSDGNGITYTVKSGNGLPNGLSLSSDGKLTGTPTKAVKNARFAITASAEGYTSVDAYFYLRINEKITTVTDGRFEAEYIDLDNFVGEGWSGTAFNEDVIQNQSPNASNGYYIGWTLRENTYSFHFNSTKAVSNTKLHVGLGTEFGNVTLTKDAFEVKMNGITLEYSSISLNGTSGTMSACQDYLVSETAKLIEGANTVELIIKNNKLLSGSRTFGPCIDYIQVQDFSDAVLTWQPCTYNLDRFN